MKRIRVRFFYAVLLWAVFAPTALLAKKAEEKRVPSPLQACLLGVRIAIDRSIDTALVARFSSSLSGALEQKFTNINLCVDTCAKGCIKTDHGGVSLDIGYEPEPDSTVYCGSIVVTFRKSMGGKSSEDNENQVLTLFQVPAGIDRGGLYMVVAEKIVENVRREVLGEVKVTSVPQGATFTIDSTLGASKAPKTLLLPPGTYQLSARMPAYLAYTDSVKVVAPGVTDVTVTLTKRRFYHSRYMPVLYAFGIATAGALGCEYYFYDRYSRLTEQDYRDRRSEFQRLFDLAKQCEYAGFALLGLTAATFSLTFFF